MNHSTGRMRQIMDWRAALWAGLVAGLVFLGLQLLLVGLYVGSPWAVLRWIAAIVLGEGVLPPPATFHAGIALVALVVHLALALVFSLLLAFTIHRWGFAVGVVGGAIFGLALYAVNFYTFSAFFPWFFALRNWMMILAHVVFGAVAGGTYELLEVEEFVPAE